MTPEEEEREILLIKKSQEIDEEASEKIWAEAHVVFNEKLERVAGKKIFVSSAGKRSIHSKKENKERLGAAVA